MEVLTPVPISPVHAVPRAGAARWCVWEGTRVIEVNEDDLHHEPYGRAWHEGRPFSGQAADRLPNGTLVSLTAYADGLPDGPDLSWYPDGTREMEGHFRQGIPVGTHSRWAPDGTLVRQVEFSEGGRIIRRLTFDREGNVLTESGG